MSVAVFNVEAGTPFQKANENVQARAELNEFLKSIERRAFKMAEFAARHRDDALEIVQDAMLSFVRAYAQKPGEQWRPLFFKVLNSRIQDHFRRSSTRSKIFVWLKPKDEDDELEHEVADAKISLPLEQLMQENATEALQLALRELPNRQRQTFLLRMWEGFDVSQTAAVMGCSEGSVKTHLFRALGTLRTKLEKHQ